MSLQCVQASILLWTTHQRGFPLWEMPTVWILQWVLSVDCPKLSKGILPHISISEKSAQVHNWAQVSNNYILNWLVQYRCIFLKSYLVKVDAVNGLKFEVFLEANKHATFGA